MREITHARAKIALTHTHTHNSCGDTHVKTSHREYTHVRTHISQPPPLPRPVSLSVLTEAVGMLTFTVRADTI